MTPNLVEYIRHPERLDSHTLFGLRALIEQYPCYQTARLLYLRNLYQLCDPSFGEEVSRAALYVADRRAIYQMIEDCKRLSSGRKAVDKESREENRTASVINQFLANETVETPKKKGKKVDATSDYIGFLLQEEELRENQEEAPLLNGHELIDNFIGREHERIRLKENPQYTPELSQEEEKPNDEGYFTETLARIYIKQGRYEKALEIIRKLSLNYPKKNRYFADQIRFLEKLIINNNNK